MLTDEEAVAAAQAAADLRVGPGSDYELHRVEWSDQDRSWWVHLVAVVPRPGGFVTVVVDARTGACRVVPGK